MECVFMSKKDNFLDPDKQHTLTEQECELISFYRFFTKAQKATLFKFAFTMAMEDKRTTPKDEK